MANYKLRNNVFNTLNNRMLDSDNFMTIDKANSPFNNPPYLTAGQVGILTIADATASPEKIEIVNYSSIIDNGNETMDILNLTRGCENTTAQQFEKGAVVLQSITKDVLDSLQDLSITSQLIENQEYSGITSSGLLKEMVYFGDVLYWDMAEGGYKKALAEVSGEIMTLPGEVMALSNGFANDAIPILHYGYVRNATWNWRLSSDENGPGNILFLSESSYGEMTQDIPTLVYNICGLVKTQEIIKFIPSSYVDLKEAIVDSTEPMPE